MKPYCGLPMTLGAAAAGVGLIVWCKECQHQEPDPAEMAARYGAETAVLDWRASRRGRAKSRDTRTLRWSERDSNWRSRCDGQRYGVRSLKRRFDRRGMTSGAAGNGLWFQLVLIGNHIPCIRRPILVGRVAAGGVLK